VGAARQALAGKAFQVIVLDVLLPDGDGLLLLDEIHRFPLNRQVPVMLLSTEAEVRDRIRGLRCGAVEYVGKPYELSCVVTRAKALLGRREPASSADARRKILLIEDSADFSAVLGDILEEAGYAVVTAATGEEGLRVAADVRPDAVILDQGLPGIDGDAVVRRLKLDASLRRTPVLMLTGNGRPQDEVRAFEAGADVFVHKDGGSETILARLAGMLREVERCEEVDLPASILGPKRILTVGDSQTHRHGLSGQLRREGHDILPARSGEEALELLAVQPVDCVLLDVTLPGGISGHETCRRIRASAGSRHLPVIMLTAHDDTPTLIEALNSGADDSITKGGDFEVLRARVRAQLRRRQIDEESRRLREQRLRQANEAAAARAAREVAALRAELLADVERKNAELTQANRELEAFGYTLSHDLQAPARHIAGFTKALLADCGDQLDERGKEHLSRVRHAASRMQELIEDILQLSGIRHCELARGPVDLSTLAREVSAELAETAPGRPVELAIEEGVTAQGDARLLRVVLENLLSNAWKFTSKHPRARIEFGRKATAAGLAYYVHDDGVGFDMAFAGKLFEPFEPLHGLTEFEGTGIGLATVRRVVQRHGGRTWIESVPHRGTTVYFTLGGEPS